MLSKWLLYFSTDCFFQTYIYSVLFFPIMAAFILVSELVVCTPPSHLLSSKCKKRSLRDWFHVSRIQRIFRLNNFHSDIFFSRPISRLARSHVTCHKFVSVSVQLADCLPAHCWQTGLWSRRLKTAESSRCCSDTMTAARGRVLLFRCHFGLPLSTLPPQFPIPLLIVRQAQKWMARTPLGASR